MSVACRDEPAHHVRAMQLNAGGVDAIGDRERAAPVAGRPGEAHVGSSFSWSPRRQCPSDRYLQSSNNKWHRDPPVDLPGRRQGQSQVPALFHKSEAPASRFVSTRRSQFHGEGLQPAAHNHRAKRMETAQCRVDRHSVGGKVAGHTSLCKCCNPDTQDVRCQPSSRSP